MDELLLAEGNPVGYVTGNYVCGTIDWHATTLDKGIIEGYDSARGIDVRGYDGARPIETGDVGVSGHTHFIRPSLYHENLRKKSQKKTFTPVMHCAPIPWLPQDAWGTGDVHPDEGREFAYAYNPQAQYEAYQKYKNENEPKPEMDVTQEDLNR